MRVLHSPAVRLFKVDFARTFERYATIDVYAANAEEARTLAAAEAAKLLNIDWSSRIEAEMTESAPRLIHVEEAKR